MAHDNHDGIYSLPAAADYSAVLRNRFVVINTSGQYALCGLGARPDAIADNFPKAAGEQVRGVGLRGIVKKIELGTGGCTLGAFISSDASGKGVVSVTSGHERAGKALRAGAAGDVVEILFLAQGSVP